MKEFKKLTPEKIATYVKEIIAGNEEHSAELYEEMRRMCHLQCKYGEYYFDHYLTEEDFFQDTIYSFLKYKHLYDEKRGSFVTWYNSIIHNLYITKYNKRKRDPDFVPLEFKIGEDKNICLEDEISPVLSAECVFFERYNMSQIIKSVHNLKPEYRDAIIYTKFQNMSAREVAEKMGISEYTFNVRNYRARKALEQKLLELEYEI